MSQIRAEAEIAAIFDLNRTDLVAAWRRAYGKPPASGLSSTLMRRVLAWEGQSKAYGGLSAQTKRALKAALAPASATAPAARPSEGSQIVREWNGAVYEVEVLAEGFRWRGAHWSSLSAVAKEITGTKWSGPRFFGFTGTRT